MDYKVFCALDNAYTLIGTGGTRWVIRGKGVSALEGRFYCLVNAKREEMTITFRGGHVHQVKNPGHHPLETVPRPDLDFPRVDFPDGFNPLDNMIVAEYNGTLEHKGDRSGHTCPPDTAG